MSMERRIEKLENYEESINPQKLIILKVQYDGVRGPTDEEIEAATKKFLEEHPGHQGYIVLNFLYLGGKCRNYVNCIEGGGGLNSEVKKEP